MGVPTFPLDLDLSDALRSVRTLQRQIQDDFSALNVDIDISNATSQELDGILERVRGIGGTRFDGLASSIEQLQRRTRAAEQDASRLGQAFEDLSNNQIAPRFNLAELDDFRSGLRAIDGATPEIRAKFDADEIRDAEQILGRINSSNPAVRATVDASEVEQLRSLIERIERETIDLDVDVDESKLDTELRGLTDLIRNAGLGAVIAGVIEGGFNQGAQRGRDILLSGFTEGSAEFAALGEVQSRLVLEGVVSGFDEAGPIVQAAAKALGEGFTSDELEALSRQVIFFEEQLGFSAQRAAELNSILTSQGFAGTPSEALDVLATTAANSQLEIEELGDLYIEYAGRVDPAIISTEQFIGLLASADTRFGADKLIDSFSEFVVKVGEGNDSTRDSFNDLGISYDDTLERINNGQAVDAFSDVLAALDDVDATQQRVLGEPIIGSVGIDQISALTAANIEAIQVQFGATQDAAERLDGPLRNIRALASDPLNGDRIFAQFEENGSFFQRALDGDFSFLGEGWPFGQSGDDIRDFNDALQGVATTAGTDAPSAAAGIGAYRNRLEEARVEAAGFEDDLFNIFTQGDAFRRQRFEVEFFANVDDPETQRQALEASFADPVEIPITIAQLQQEEEYLAQLAEFTPRVQALFGNPFGLQPITDEDLNAYLTRIIELQATVAEYQFNLLRLEEQLSDEEFEAFLEIIEPLSEEAGALFTEEFVNQIGTPEFDVTVGQITGAVDAAALAERFNQALAEAAVSDLPISLQLNDDELQVLGQQQFGVDVVANLDSSQLAELVEEEYGVDVELVPGPLDIPDPGPVTVPVNAEINALLDGQAFADAIQQALIDAGLEDGGVFNNDGVQMFERGGFVAHAPGRGVPVRIPGGGIGIMGESHKGPEAAIYGDRGLAIVGGYHEEDLTDRRLLAAGVKAEEFPRIQRMLRASAVRTPDMAVVSELAGVRAQLAESNRRLAELERHTSRLESVERHTRTTAVETAETVSVLDERLTTQRAQRKSTLSKVR